MIEVAKEKEEFLKWIEHRLTSKRLIKQSHVCRCRGAVFKAESSLDRLAKAEGQFLKLNNAYSSK